MEEVRPGIYLREPQKAFENAIKKGHNVKDTHMYMYTRGGNGKPYDVFKNIMTRHHETCLLYTSPSPRDGLLSRMPSSA